MYEYVHAFGARGGGAAWKLFRARLQIDAAVLKEFCRVCAAKDRETRRAS